MIHLTNNNNFKRWLFTFFISIFYIHFFLVFCFNFISSELPLEFPALLAQFALVVPNSTQKRQYKYFGSLFLFCSRLVIFIGPLLYPHFFFIDILFGCFACGVGWSKHLFVCHKFIWNKLVKWD